MMIIFILHLTFLVKAAVIIHSSLSKFQNGWDKEFAFNPGKNGMITGVESHNANSKEDRRWRFDYGYAEGVSCHQGSWTSWRNDFDRLLDFTCGRDQVLSGIRSYHSNSKEDRRWKFRCCHVSSNVRLANSRSTDLLNDWDDGLNFRCGASEVLNGFRSSHSNKKEDRRWIGKCVALVDNDVQVIGTPFRTSYLNQWDKPLNYVDRTGRYVLSGLFSYHSNSKKDRRYGVYKSRISFKCTNPQWSGHLNHYDGHFTRTCGANKAVNGIYSVHDNSKEDRRFKMSCCDISDGGKFSITNVYTTGYVNEVDGEMNFRCGYMEVMVGLESYHNNGNEDRRFKFFCGRVVPRDDAETVLRSFASWSGYLNSWDGVLSYTSSGNELIVGFQSRHDNGREDRRWKIGTATLGGALCSPGDWSSYVNDYDASVEFLCPAHHALAGVYSKHHNSYEDRVWKFKCCDLSASGFYKLKSPVAQSTANRFDGVLHEECLRNSVVVGVVSVHDNSKEDRVFGFYCSQLTRVKSYFQEVSNKLISSECTVSDPELVIAKRASAHQDNRYSSVSTKLTLSDVVQHSIQNKITASESFCSSETLSRTKAYSWSAMIGFHVTTTIKTGEIFPGSEVEFGIKTELTKSGTITTSSESSQKSCASEGSSKGETVTLKDERSFTTEVPANQCIKLEKQVRFYKAPVQCSELREITAIRSDGTSVEYDELLEVFRKSGIKSTPHKNGEHALRYLTSTTLELASHTESTFSTRDCP